MVCSICICSIKTGDAVTRSSSLDSYKHIQISVVQLTTATATTAARITLAHQSFIMLWHSCRVCIVIWGLHLDRTWSKVLHGICSVLLREELNFIVRGWSSRLSVSSGGVQRFLPLWVYRSCQFCFLMYPGIWESFVFLAPLPVSVYDNWDLWGDLFYWREIWALSSSHISPWCGLNFFPNLLLCELASGEYVLKVM